MSPGCTARQGQNRRLVSAGSPFHFTSYLVVRRTLESTQTRSFLSGMSQRWVVPHLTGSEGFYRKTISILDPRNSWETKSPCPGPFPKYLPTQVRIRVVLAYWVNMTTLLGIFQLSEYSVIDPRLPCVLLSKSVTWYRFDPGLISRCFHRIVS